MSNSIAIIVLDTLRYDSFSEHFGWLEGKHFSNAYSTSHWTIPAHASLLTGKYASEVGVHAHSRNFDYEGETLPEKLQKRGYETRLNTANIHIYKWGGWDRGFNETVGPFDLEPSNTDLYQWSDAIIDSESSGKSFYLNAIKDCLRSEAPSVSSLKKGAREFIQYKKGRGGARSLLKRVEAESYGENEFLLLNLMETHTPYYPPSAYRNTWRPIDVVIGDGFADTVDNPAEVRTAYDNASAYLSDIYKQIHKRLLENFDYVFVLSDHGEMLGEDGMWNHGYGLYSELTHIPLVISGKDIEPGECKKPVSILDIHKSVCELANVDNKSRGQDLFEKIQPKDRLVEYHGLLPGHRNQFIERGIEDQYDDLNEPLYGIISDEGNYAYQTHSQGIKQDGTENVESVRKRIERTNQKLDKKDEQTNENLPEGLRQHLEDLGYA